MAQPVAGMPPMRALLILFALLSGFCSFVLYVVADNRSYMNGLFYGSEPGGGISAVGTVENIECGGWFISGQKLDRVRIDYWLGEPFGAMHTQASVAHDVSCAWKKGDRIPIRFSGDGPEDIRIDQPSETQRYRMQANVTYAASMFALLVCVGCALDQARFKAR
jgi:hypothetical protein